MTIRGFFLLSCLLLPVASSSFADSSCHGVDLRRPDLNQPQSQVFKDADGKVTDSGQCANFSSALLTSQLLGISINAIDFAFQNNLTIMDRDRNSPGFCRQEAVDAFLAKKQNGFIQVFGDYVRQVSGQIPIHLIEMNPSDLQKVTQWLNDICGERIQDPPGEWTTIDLKPKGSIAVAYNYPMMDAAEMGDKIDHLLDAGRFVSYTHSFHTVTIVGRTEDCRYIIQDSIPESAWNVFGGLKVSLSAQSDQDQITFENQFFQYWPRAILLKNAARIWFVETPARNLKP
jgi:hypothetical protein